MAPRTIILFLKNAYHEISLKAKSPYKETMGNYVLTINSNGMPIG